MYVLDTRYLANTSPLSLQSTYETMVILRKFLMVITLQVLTERANRKIRKQLKASQTVVWKLLMVLRNLDI